MSENISINLRYHLKREQLPYLQTKMTKLPVGFAIGLLRYPSCYVALFYVIFSLENTASGASFATQARGIGEMNHFANSHHLSDEEVAILDRAAEFGIRQLSPENEKNNLRGVLGFEKESASGTRVLLKLHVLYQKERGPLRDRYFSVYVNKYHTGAVRFTLKSPQKEEERMSRDVTEKRSCDQLSSEANCSECGFHGICVQGTARISPWLQFALKTQRELQIDVPVDHVQVLGAHNSYNNRASGYGDLDDCHWPLRIDDVCISLANQEFSFTDQLNMGVRNLEIDLWDCFGKIRMSHGNKEMKVGCLPWDKEFIDGMKELSDWTRKSENRNEILEIYFDDHTTDSADWRINHAIKKYFDNKVLTSADLKLKFSDRWPTIREMRQMKKTVIFIDENNHSGRYLHKHLWTQGFTVNSFSPQLKNCSAIGDNKETVRIYSDSTVYGPLWNGIKQQGTIMDFKKYLLCGVSFPSADQINSELMKTAVFTWAEGEPKHPINESSCVVLSSEGRWHLAQCNEDYYFACVSRLNENIWEVSSDVGKYFNPLCREGMEFSVPGNGYQHQELVRTAKGKKVWLNLTPFIHLLKE